MSYQSEMSAFSAEVEEEAARLIRDGYAAPFDAIAIARESVKRRRQKKADQAALSRPPAPDLKEHP
jgi:hypothetical protein